MVPKSIRVSNFVLYLCLAQTMDMYIRRMGRHKHVFWLRSGFYVQESTHEHDESLVYTIMHTRRGRLVRIIHPRLYLFIMIVWNLDEDWKPSVFWIQVYIKSYRGWTNILLTRSCRLMCIMSILFYKHWFSKWSERSLVKTNARSRHSSTTHRIYDESF